ncbi:MAG: TetR/AcrR family transcriptional regulator [Myxococcota bacterium]|nr:TetR/AcrR family transcriptional regulator [Myxococcota bacterium]
MSPAPEVRVPRQPRARRTRAAILAAARQEFSMRGHAGATSKTIADRAGVSVGSLYQYFEDKDHVLREIARERADEIAEQTRTLLEDPGEKTDGDLSGRVRQRLRRVVELVVEQHRHDTGLHAVLTERRHVDPALDAITSAFERGLVEHGAALLEAWGHPGDCLATSFVLFTMVEGAVHTQVLGEAVVSDDRLFESLLDALVRVALPT